MTPTRVERVRGVLAALGLLAFVIGIPYGLLALGASPARLIPDRWPNPTPISQWPQRVWYTLRWAWLTGDLVIWLIVAVAWAGWLALTLSVAAEVIRQTGHGVRAARGTLNRVPRGRWIAGLVAAVLVATSAGTAMASGTPAAPVTATAPPWPPTHPLTTAPEPGTRTVNALSVRTANATTSPSMERQDKAVPHTVIYGDTLWGLAERYLGNGIRYHEIVRLNPALLAGAPDYLEPGWTLRLPSDAVGLRRPADTTEATGRTVTVRLADTLSGIAERELNDPQAWPVLFDLNVGRTQPDGRALRHPDQLMPGWNLVLPSDVPPLDKPPSPPSGSSPVPASPQDPPGSGKPPAPHTRHGDQQHPPDPHPATGIALPTGAFVGLGLAALVTIAMISVRLRRRRWYQPGSPDQPDPAGLPVVRALRIAHDAATRAPDDNATPVTAPALGRTRPTEMDARDRAQATAQAVLPELQDTPLGVRDGQDIALDLARTHGLGLVGPGTHAAVRALIVTLLARTTNNGIDTMIVIPAADARSLFGHDLADRVPQRLRIVDDMPAALDALEAELLARTHAQDNAKHDPSEYAPQPRDNCGPVLVVATPTPATDRRAHSVLTNGAHLGLAGVFLGPWRPGGTAHVGDDGTVQATSPTLSKALTNARLFTLPGTDALDLLALLQTADPGTDERPHSHSSPESAADPASQRSSRIQGADANAEPLTSDYEFIKPVPEPATDTAPVTPTTSAMIDIPDRHPAETLPAPAEATGSGSPPHVSNDTSDRSTTSAPSADDRLVEAHPPTRTGPVAPLHLNVLGRLHLTRANPEPRDLIDAFAPRQREILVYLALHREGSRRETLTAALWPDAPGERPYNSFHATLSQMRRALRTATGNGITDITINQDGHYSLDQSVVTVDLWHVQDALTARRRAATPAEKAEALQHIAKLYRGDLAEGIAADWIDAPREALRREILDAFSAHIRAIGKDQPEQTLTLLEQARHLDPYNEAIYRDIMRTQARLGQYDSIPRTLGLLTNALATLDQRPTRDSLGLADFLRRPGNNHLRDQKAS